MNKSSSFLVDISTYISEYIHFRFMRNYFCIKFNMKRLENSLWNVGKTNLFIKIVKIKNKLFTKLAWRNFIQNGVNVNIKREPQDNFILLYDTIHNNKIRAESTPIHRIHPYILNQPSIHLIQQQTMETEEIHSAERQCLVLKCTGVQQRVIYVGSSPYCEIHFNFTDRTVTSNIFLTRYYFKPIQKLFHVKK